MLLNRKHFSVMILMGWSLVKMLFVLGIFFLSFKMQREMLPLVLDQQKKVMEKAGGAGSEQMIDIVSGATEVLSIAMLFVGLAWVMVLPIFMLIWFIRPKIRKEVAGWGTAN